MKNNIMNYEKDCSILVSSCDAYLDILDTFFYLMKKYWPDNPFKIYLSTESINYHSNFFNVENIHPSKKEITWTERICDALAKIDSDYIVLILDDFFFFDYTNTQRVKECISFLKKDSKIVTFTFWPQLISSNNCKYDYYYKRRPFARYKIAAILGIWNKKQFQKYLSAFKNNIWEWEKNATLLSNTKYKKDKFYVTQSIDKNVFHYDFTMYGLFSGKWIKNNKELMEKESLSINYDERGFYDERLLGLNKSIINAFTLNSSIVPYYSVNNKKHTYKQIVNKLDENKFEQLYDVNGAFNIIRWEPFTLRGLGIEDLEIEIEYKDKSLQIINNNDLFGSFIVENETLIFNNATPYVNIPTFAEKYIKKLHVSGKLLFPLDEDKLLKSYNKETKAKNTTFEKYQNDLWQEFLKIPDRVEYIQMDSKLQLVNDYREYEIKYELNYVKNGRFSQKYDINSKIEEIKWIPSSYGIFLLKNLSIIIVDINDQKIKIDLSLITGKFYIYKKQYIIYNDSVLSVKFHCDYVKAVIISGKMMNPVPISVLQHISK